MADQGWNEWRRRASTSTGFSQHRPRPASTTASPSRLQSRPVDLPGYRCAGGVYGVIQSMINALLRLSRSIVRANRGICCSGDGSWVRGSSQDPPLSRSPSVCPPIIWQWFKWTTSVGATATGSGSLLGGTIDRRRLVSIHALLPRTVLRLNYTYTIHAVENTQHNLNMLSSFSSTQSPLTA